ncbi:MAG: tetratricopeptide repeat protein, partial [Anaerolineae bacterium]
PNCGFDNPPGMKFCGQCATQLANLCPNCSFENPQGFKFCGNCGQNLLAATVSKATDDEEMLRRLQSYIPGHLVDKILQSGRQIEGERRNVTVLFADISGFTAMSEKLDPEEVFLIIDEAMKAFSEEIYRFEGTIDKFTGDGLMALFGAPIAHENDPERAVRAALGMQQALAEFNKGTAKQLGTTLKMRIGLNAGTVVAGGMGSDLRMDYTVMGDTVNTASRLEEAAEPGTILVSRSVYEPTAPLFNYEELSPITVKGKKEPLPVYQVIGIKERPGPVRGIEGLRAPLIGRQKELAQLKQAADRLLDERQGQIVLVTGDAGIGKSRLTEEFKEYLAEREVIVVEGACVAYARSISYWIFLQMLKAYFGLQDDDSEYEKRWKIEHKVETIAPRNKAEVVPFIEDLLSVELVEDEYIERTRHLGPAQLRQQTFLAMRQLFLSEAARQPLVLILDDLHWVDKPSLDLLLFLLGTVEQAPIMVYCISRPEDGQAHQEIAKIATSTYADRFTTLRLKRLTSLESTELVGSLLTIAELPDSLRQMISDKAEGNPFYLEELIRMFIDRGIIRRTDNRWQMAPDADLKEIEVPSTLQGLILARIDSLDDDPKYTVQCASVIGRTFQYPVLDSVRNGTAPASLENDLNELERHDLIRLRSQLPELEYIFKHILTQETVYRTLLIRKRQKLHQRVGEALETLYHDRLSEYVELLAYHYDIGQVAEKALQYLIMAGKKAASRYANEQALEYFGKAKEIIEKGLAGDTQERIDVAEGLGDAQSLTGKYDAAITNYQETLSLMRSGDGYGNARQMADITRRIGRTCERQGDYDEAMRWLEQALSELTHDSERGPAVERARIYNDLGWVNYRQGNFEKAYDWAMGSLGIVEGTRHYNETASAYNRLVGVFYHKGDWKQATEYGEKGLRLRERIGDTYGVATSLQSLGAMYIYLGNWELAIRNTEKSLGMMKEMGDPAVIAAAYNNLGFTYEEKGDCDRAVEHLQKSIEIAERINNAYLMALSKNNLARVSIVQDDWAQAIEYLNDSTRVANEIGSSEHLAEAYWLLGEAHLGLGELVKAEESCQQSLKLSAEIGSAANEGSARRVLGMIRRAQGSLAKASEHLTSSMQIFGDLNYQFELAKSQFQMALVRRDMGQTGEALEHLEKALGVFRRLEVERDIQRAEEELTKLKELQGQL